METLVYSKGGDVYHGTQDLTLKEVRELIVEHKEKGAVGYMKGYRYWGGQRKNVIVFFSERPEIVSKEEKQRRENGFLGAKWHIL